MTQQQVLPEILWFRPSRRHAPVLMTLQACVVCRWEQYGPTAPDRREAFTGDACQHFPQGMAATTARHARQAGGSE